MVLSAKDVQSIPISSSFVLMVQLIKGPLLSEVHGKTVGSERHEWSLNDLQGRVFSILSSKNAVKYLEIMLDRMTPDLLSAPPLCLLLNN